MSCWRGRESRAAEEMKGWEMAEMAFQRSDFSWREEGEKATTKKNKIKNAP